MTATHIAWRVGICDALILLLTPFALILAATDDPIDRIYRQLLNSNFFLLLFVCSYVGWRGKAHAERLLRGERSWLRSLIEGFASGYFSAAVLFLAMPIQESWAAGTGWEGAASWTAKEWFYYSFEILLVVGPLAGAWGAVIAAILDAINRVLIHSFNRSVAT